MEQPMDPSPEPNTPSVEPVPVLAELVAPPPAVNVELVKPGDPVIEIQHLREQQRRWKVRFIVSCVAFIVLLGVSALQFIGTFITCQILFDARRDSERSQRQTTELLKELADARTSMNQAVENLIQAELRCRRADSIKMELELLEKNADRLGESEREWRKARQDITEVFAEQQRKLRDIDAMLERARRINNAEPEPFQDPSHKHGRACPVDQWPGFRGTMPAREPTAVQLEEEEHQFAVLSGPPGGDTGTVDDESMFFSKHVLPIFEEKCGRCHLPPNRIKGKLNLQSVTSILKGGESGPAVVPGDLKNSLLWDLIINKDMPPKGEPKLTEQEIDAIRRWIATMK
jgi:hypothetical protein